MYRSISRLTERCIRPLAVAAIALGIWLTSGLTLGSPAMPQPPDSQAVPTPLQGDLTLPGELSLPTEAELRQSAIRPTSASQPIAY